MNGDDSEALELRRKELIELEKDTKKEQQLLLAMIMEREEHLSKREAALNEREHELLAREKKLNETKNRLLELAKTLKEAKDMKE
ncbi:MAG: hypothetical protein V1934_00835 [Methanobacteriota archaeon]